MRVGFDIDGVLANFIAAYQSLFVKTTGRDDFKPGDAFAPPEWNWPTLRGYTDKETAAVWKVIRQDETFWRNLAPYNDNTSALRAVLKVLETTHEVYYITDRIGADAKRQTKFWLIEHLHYLGITHTEPTVLLTATGEKGHIIRALKIDAYIDDKFENVRDIARDSPNTRLYYLTRSYNETLDVPEATRVDSLGEMFDKEISLKNL